MPLQLQSVFLLSMLTKIAINMNHNKNLLKVFTSILLHFALLNKLPGFSQCLCSKVFSCASMLARTVPSNGFRNMASKSYQRIHCRLLFNTVKLYECYLHLSIHRVWRIRRVVQPRGYKQGTIGSNKLPVEKHIRVELLQPLQQCCLEVMTQENLQMLTQKS